MSDAHKVLRKLRINRVASVDRGAGEGVQVVLMKRQTPDEIAMAEALAKAAGDGSHPDNEGDPMSSEIKKALGLADTATDAEVAAAITKANTAAAEVAKSVEILKAKAAMSDKEKAFMDGKTDDEVCKFMAKSETERAAEIAKAAAGDETVEIEGRTISKRAVGDDMFAVMKAQAKRISDNEAEIAKARETAATATFEKRASDDFKHLAGTIAERGAVLKFLDTAPAEVKKAAEAILKAAEAATAFAFSKRGTSMTKAGADGEEPVSAEAKLEKMAKDRVEKSAGKLTFAKAYDEVIQENAALYEEMLTGETADA